MKKKPVFLVLAILLGFEFVLSGCATDPLPAAEAPADEVFTDEAPAVPKTLIITGFNLPMEGIRQIKVDLTGDWLDEQNWWVIPANCVAKVDGQTLTAWLYVGDSDERWTGTGEYGVNIYLISEEDKPPITYRYRYNMPGIRTVNIKDAETTLEWSNFVFAWDD
jgi:hypothetical protein